MMEAQVEETTLRTEAREVIEQLRAELSSAAKIGEIHTRIEALERVVGEVRVDLRRLIEVFERLNVIGAWAVKATPWIVAFLSGSNLIRSDLLARLVAGP